MGLRLKRVEAQRDHTLHGRWYRWYDSYWSDELSCVSRLFGPSLLESRLNFLLERSPGGFGPNGGSGLLRNAWN
jgi:hypothetical protein